MELAKPREFVFCHPWARVCIANNRRKLSQPPGLRAHYKGVNFLPLFHKTVFVHCLEPYPAQHMTFYLPLAFHFSYTCIVTLILIILIKKLIMIYERFEYTDLDGIFLNYLKA